MKLCFYAIFIFVYYGSQSGTFHPQKNIFPKNARRVSEIYMKYCC